MSTSSRPVVHFVHPWSLEDRKPYMELPFPLHEYHRRLRALQMETQKAGLEAMIVVGDIRERGPVRWLSNFYALLGETAIVVPVEGEPVLVTSAAAHGEPMHSFVFDTWIPDMRCAIHRSPPANAPIFGGQLIAVLKEKRLNKGRIGVCNWRSLCYDWVVMLKEALPDVEWVDATRTANLARAQKSDLEMEMIERAQHAVDLGFFAALKAAQPGVSELEVCAELEYAMRRAGVHTVAYLFDTRVCSGHRAALKNANPTERRMRKGDPVFIDVSATYNGYACDTAMSTVVGCDPTPEQERFLETGALMSEAVLAAAKPGVPAPEIVEVARRVAREMGEEKWFLEYIAGHGIGAAQVEMPFITPHSPDVLAERMTFSIEPMLVDPARGTACLEFLCTVTPEGGRMFTRLPVRPWKEL